VGRKIFRGGGERKIGQKIAKNIPKNSTIKPLPEGPTEKRPKNGKKTPKNSTFKPLSTIFVPCMKIQGGSRPAADAHGQLSFELHAPAIQYKKIIANKFWQKFKPKYDSKCVIFIKKL